MSARRSHIRLALPVLTGLLLAGSSLAFEPIPMNDGHTPPPIPRELIESLNQQALKPTGPTDSRGEVVLLSDGFEGSFPGTAWQVYPGTGANDAYWGKQSALVFEGSGAVFCAGAGTAAVAPGNSYPDNMDAYMVTAPFDLSDATAAVATFRADIKVEENWDYFYCYASTDNFATYDYWYVTEDFDWGIGTYNFANTPNGGSMLGNSQVRLMLRFFSDESFGETGVFVDNVVITKTTSGTATPTPTPTPSPTVTASPTPSPTVSPSPSPSPTPSGAYQKTFTVYNDGTANLLVNQIDEEQGSAWLSVAAPSGYPVAITPGGNATFTVTADPTGLSGGNYSDRLLVYSNDSTQSPYSGGVNVNLQIGTQVTDTMLVNHILQKSGGAYADPNGDGLVDVSDAVKTLVGRRGELTLH